MRPGVELDPLLAPAHADERDIQQLLHQARQFVGETHDAGFRCAAERPESMDHYAHASAFFRRRAEAGAALLARLVPIVEQLERQRRALLELGP